MAPRTKARKAEPPVARPTQEMQPADSDGEWEPAEEPATKKKTKKAPAKKKVTKKAAAPRKKSSETAAPEATGVPAYGTRSTYSGPVITVVTDHLPAGVVDPKRIVKGKYNTPRELWEADEAARKLRESQIPREGSPSLSHTTLAESEDEWEDIEEEHPAKEEHLEEGEQLEQGEETTDSAASNPFFNPDSSYWSIPDDSFARIRQLVSSIVRDEPQYGTGYPQYGADDFQYEEGDPQYKSEPVSDSDNLEKPVTSSGMVENIPSTTGGETQVDDATRGLPYYNQIKGTTRNLLKKKAETDEKVAQANAAVWNKETTYLEDTPAGNILKGFDGYIKSSTTAGSAGTGGTSSRRKATISDNDRLFSRSSTGYWSSMRENSPQPSTHSTPSHAPTPTASGGQKDATTAPTSAVSTKGPGLKKVKKADKEKEKEKEKAGDEDEDAGKPNKRLKISYARGEKDKDKE